MRVYPNKAIVNKRGTNSNRLAVRFVPNALVFLSQIQFRIDYSLISIVHLYFWNGYRGRKPLRLPVAKRGNRENIYTQIQLLPRVLKLWGMKREEDELCHIHAENFCERPPLPKPPHDSRAGKLDAPRVQLSYALSHDRVSLKALSASMLHSVAPSLSHWGSTLV